MRAPPTSDNDPANSHGQVDNYAHLARPQFVAFEATGRVATAALFVMANTTANRLLMAIHGIQNWRSHQGQDDERMILLKRNGPMSTQQSGSFLFFLRATPKKGGGLLERMRAGGLGAGFWQKNPVK